MHADHIEHFVEGDAAHLGGLPDGDLSLPEEIERIIDSGLAQSSLDEPAKGLGAVRLEPLREKERRTSEAFRRGAPVGRGEADALAVAEVLSTPVLMDDRVAVDLARMRGVETRWTTTVVLEAQRKGILDRRAARRALEDLIASGLWIRQDVLLRLLSILSEG